MDEIPNETLDADLELVLVKCVERQRSFLAAISIESETVAENLSRDIEDRQPIERIRENIAAADVSLAKVLRFVKAGEFTERSRQRIDRLIEFYAAALEDRVQKAGRRITCGPLPSASAIASRGLIEWFLDEAVGNACQYSSPQSEILISALIEHGGRMNGAVSISVDDSGPGVPDEELEKIGTPFWRSIEHRGSNGTGLGLAIIRREAGSCGAAFDASRSTLGGLRITISIQGVRMES